MKRTKFLILVAVFVLLLTVAAILYAKLSDDMGGGTLAPPETESETENPEETTSESTNESPPETIPAPDFTVYDVNGNPAKLSDYFGKPIVLNFWASWCSPCKSEMPEFHEVYLEQGEEIQFLMVNMTTSQRESFAKASGYIEESGFTFPVLYDLDSAAYLAYRVYSMPTTYFLNAKGELVTYAIGAIDKDTLLYAIDLIS